MTAAVADYRPTHEADQKIKKSGDAFQLELTRTKDILQSVGVSKGDRQILVGFALETQNELENAKSKLERKNLDLIVLNSLQDSGAGFGHDTNKVTLIDKNGQIDRYPLKSKSQVAKDILTKIIQLSES
jgi:phosphopantothenoylcysteine decarboxylase/phosphopantothenate--cysteine ligase